MSNMNSEEVYEIEQVMQNETKDKKDVCLISKKGLTLFGRTISWLVIIIIIIAIYLYLNRNGILTQSVSSVMTESSSMGKPSVDDMSIMTGGFKKLNLNTPGQVRQMFGH